MSNLHPSVGTKRALLIGVERAQGRSGFARIRFAHRDTRAMQEFLGSRSGYSDDNMVVMLDNKDHPKKWWPTKRKILKQIDLLVKDAAENDQFFVYFSGHGLQVPCRHNTEDDGLDEAMLTGDGKNILDNVLRERLVNPLLKVKNVKLFVLFDCCHSATMLDLPCRSLNSTRLGRMFSGIAEGISIGIASILRRRKTDVQPVSKAPENGHEPVQVRSVTFDSTATSGLCLGLLRVNTPAQVLEQVEPEVNSARVISLSACRDSEQAYDDNKRGDTMTKFFIGALTDKYDRTWLELLEEIRQRINELSRRRAEESVRTTINLQRTRHSAAGRQSSRRATITSTFSVAAMDQQMHGGQNPQYGKFGPVVFYPCLW
ncbi:hypothetical protein BS17DRAFT_567372 [Gyrodon lividus]|nr:hypothetical protein BS17DRAFT_567372 [Gyrodon lividus]